MCGHKSRQICLGEKRGLLRYSGLVSMWYAPAKPCFKINQRNISFEFKEGAPEKPVYSSYVASQTGLAFMWHFVAFENTVK